MSPGKPQFRWKRLIALDFDCTIADQNTDIVVRDLLPADALTDDHRKLYTEEGWTDYMQAIFRTLHASGFRREQIDGAIRSIDEVAGMTRLVSRLIDEHNFDACIISDSNAVFIDEWLRSHSLAADRFAGVFTNPAEYDRDSGLLRIRPHHQQTECSLSTVNLCKGRVLDEFIHGRMKPANAQPIAYAQIFYVGDGRNDVCPALRLSSVDVACARSGFSMLKDLRRRQLLDDNPAERPACEVLQWTDGNGLYDEIVARLRDEHELSGRIRVDETLNRRDAIVPNGLEN